MEPNYSEAPKSFTEMKADKTGRSDDWSPRDALISVLRDIDNGVISPETVIICYFQPETENLEEGTNVVVAGKANWVERVGILEMCKLSVI